MDLDESEINYIEYRRHSASHIFQNQYEHIQRESLKIKKERKGVKIENLNKQFQELIVKFGSDKNVDIHLNNKIQPKLKSIYEQLKK